MKQLFILSAFTSFSFNVSSQTVYSDQRVINISDFIYQLERRDSGLTAELSSMDKAMFFTGDASHGITVCGNLAGLGKQSFALSGMAIDLVIEAGEVLTQKTNEKGHFSFPGIDPAKNYSLRLNKEAAKTIKSDKIIITDCTGKIVKTIDKSADGSFEYKVLDSDKAQLNTIGDPDPVMKLKAIKENYKKLQEENTVAKACKGNYDSLQVKYNDLEKKYNDLKNNSAAKNSDSDDLLKDPTKNGQYLKNIPFKINNSAIDETAHAALEEAIIQIKGNKTLKFNIIGHSDNTGTEAKNEALSKSRAMAVKNYLISKGVKASNISCQWFSATQPLASNDTEEGRAKNRRVEIKVKK
ncbi:MAG: outer membrane protein/peptidoglycan-associated protein [Bacteroidetes bacterium]|nr:outer membrane protein/peptidoglycan-associated protein [Bacteroidota bacterium]